MVLVAEANQLAGRVHPILRNSIGDLVRSMNCYYSNLIEGHDTHPRDIDRALANNFSDEPKRRELQQEAVAHIHVQRLIDSGEDPMPGLRPQLTAPGYTKSSAHGFPRNALGDQPFKRRARACYARRMACPRRAGRTPYSAQIQRPSTFPHALRWAYQSPPLSKLRRIQAVGAVHHRFLSDSPVP